MTFEQININIKNALINHNTRSKNLWKDIKAKASSIAKDNKESVSDAICAAAVKKELKELEQTLTSVPSDSILAAETRESIEELSQYLPKQLTDEELKQRILGIVMVMPGGTPFGAKMKACIKELGEVADGKRISKILKEL